VSGPSTGDGGHDGSNVDAPNPLGGDSSASDAAIGGEPLVEAGGSDAPPAIDAGLDADACAPIAPGYALSFDNASQPQYVTVGDATALHLTTAMTIEAWVIVQDTSFNCIVCKPYGSATDDTLALWFESGPLYWGLNAPSTSGALSVTWSSDAGAWRHIAATWDSVAQKQQLFMDGTLAGTIGSVTGTPTYDTHPLLIGSDINNGLYSLGYKGTIDEVRLFSTVRTSQQIVADMAGRCSPVGDPTLVAYYPFNEGSGTVVHDATSNHIDGTLGNGDAGTAPTWVTSTMP
jgi:hypothetical protein